MFIQWVNGEEFKQIGQHRQCKSSLVASTCRNLAKKLIHRENWDQRENLQGQHNGDFHCDKKTEWIKVAKQ